jgi:hypothetical protein
MTKKVTYKFGFCLSIIAFIWTALGLTSTSVKKNKQTWNIGETTSKFTITLPKDYSAELLEVKPGHFQSMFIKGPNNVPDSLKFQINIRTGFFPTYRTREIHFRDPVPARKNIKLLGQDIEFLVVYEPELNIYLIEQIISLDNVKQGLKADICIIADKKKNAEELIKILETLKLEGANSTPVPTVVVIDPQTKGIFDRHRRIVKYGTTNDGGKLINGSMYYHNSDGSLSKIEIYKDGNFVRDSVMVK